MFSTVVFTSLAILLLYFSRRFLVDKLLYKLPPGPTPLPVIGTLWIFRLLNERGVGNFFQMITELHKSYGKIYTMYQGALRLVIIGDAELVHEALVAKDKFFSSRPANSFIPKSYLSPGVVNASGAEWRHRRRFAVRALRDFGMGKKESVSIVHDEVGYFVAEIDKFKGKPFDPHGLINNVVANVICSIVFGKRFDYDDSYFKAILQKTAAIFSDSPGRDPITFLFPVIGYIRVPSFFKKVAALEVHLKEMLMQTVTEHRKTFNKDDLRNFADLFIDTEMARGEAITLSDLTRITLDLFMAGTETTATALNWTFVWFCKHPEIQSKCQLLVDNAIGASDRLPTLEDRPDLIYIDAVLHEVLRHPSIAPQGLSHANTTGIATVGGYDVPAGTVVLANIWNVHHDETYWKEPLEFNPDRWIDDHGKLVNHGNHFIPFGSGPRVCLGETLARVEYFLILVSLLQRFTFSFAPGEDVDINNGAAGVTYVPPEYKLVATRRS